MNNASPQAGNGRTRSSRVRTKTLPKLRSRLGTLLISVAGLISFAVGYISKETNHSTVDNCFLLIGLPFSLLCLVEVGTRSLYAFEEYNHLFTRYDNSFATLLKDVFHFSSGSIVSAIISILAFAMNSQHSKNPIRLWYEMGPTSCLTSLLSAYILSNLLELRSGHLYDSLWIENSNGLDYGSGMAHSFFHGYLKLIIPKTGNKEKYLEELMKDYEAKHDVQLIHYKLFILIPKSLYCPTSLMNEQISPSIEESSSLDPKVQTVAGVKDRVYKNSVYKIKRESGKRIYVAAEYATPLKTFHGVLDHNGVHSFYYNKYKNEIVLQFYLTLQKVLKEHVDCTDFCELIYYDDKDENGKYRDVGEVLLQRIRKLERKKSLSEQ